MEGRARRTAGFPRESLSFEVSRDPECAGVDIRWSGGGDPPSGTGNRFTTSFDSGGAHTVTATCGTASHAFEVEICPLDEWLAAAREYYGPSIDFARVRIKSSWAVLGPAGTAWTCNDVVRFKRPGRAEDLPREPTLIHELGHVWEHQSGQVQLLSGVIEQVRRRFGKDPYDYGGPGGVARAQQLTTFGKEGQAQILAECWKARHGYQRDRKEVPFSTQGYVENMQRLVDGAGIGARPSGRRRLGGGIDSAVAFVVNSVLRVFE